MRRLNANKPERLVRLSLERAHLATARARTERDFARIRLAETQAALAQLPGVPRCTCSRSPIRGYARPDVPCPAHLADAELTFRGTRDRLCQLLEARDGTIAELKRELATRGGAA